MVSVLPFHNPVELAEQFSLLDQVTNGRLNLGVGSGYIPLEFEGFGVDPNTKRERFDRSLDTLLAALRGSEVQVDAEKGRPVRLNVLPQQTPHPPLWIAVQRREAIPFVARRGVNLALVPYATVGSPEELGDEINDFRAHLPAGVRAEVSVALHVYAGSHPDRARAAFQRFLDSRLATQSTFYQEKVKRDPRHGSAEEIERSGLAVIGSPREVMESLERFRRLGVDEVLGIVDFGGLARADVAESVRTLGEVAGRLGPAADPAPMTAGSEVE
jgi:alkanesulfonate monooxygenase SsuD/methylene tetrahydromethanopterin reductase-like flavin-dependent oxidoreductase (luciferase family)